MNPIDNKNTENPNMPDGQEFNLQSGEMNDFNFLQEKIKERPINKRKLLKRTIITAMMAVLFGLLACLSFVLLEPVLNNWLYPEEEPEIVTFPQEQEEMLPGDMLTEGSTVQTQESVSDVQTEQGSTDLENTNESHTDVQEEESPLEQYTAYYDELYKAYKEVSSSMVTVTAVHSDVDWFNNTYESEGTTAGVIIANNNRELLILTRKSTLDTAESICVTFCNGVDAYAILKKYDSNTDLAVLAADLKYVGSSTLDSVTVATLGSSASSGLVGKPVMAIGNIFGYKDSVCYGIVTSKGNNVELADSEYKLITTDIYASENPSGILVSLSGEVIGIIDNSYNNPDTSNLLSALGITELKGMITKLSNGEDISYLGIYTQDIPAQVRMEMGMPQGAYIFDIDMDSPAMLKGIQKGDIIVQIGSEEIRSASDYMNALRNAELDRSLRIVVQRANAELYEEMTFTVQPSHAN